MGRPESATRSIPWVVAIALLVASGIVQGRLDGRWATAGGLDAAVERLRALPATLGTWRGEEGDADLKTLNEAGIAGGVLKRYRDSTSGEVVTAMLVCGRPGPVAVHTPDVCYQGSGYAIESGPAEVFPGFLGTTVARKDGPVSERLQVYWTWNADDGWESPSNPRVRFGARPYLYKLYVVRPTPGAEAKRSTAVDRFCLELASDLKPKLRAPDR